MANLIGSDEEKEAHALLNCLARYSRVDSLASEVSEEDVPGRVDSARIFLPGAL